MPFEVRDDYVEDATLEAGKLEYERGWKVWKTTAGTVVQSTAAEAFGAVLALYPFGSAFPGLAGVRLYGINPTLGEPGSHMWLVKGRYKIPNVDTPPDDFEELMTKSGQEKSGDNPFGAEFSGGGNVVDEYFAEDLDGKPWVNSAKQGFANLVPIPVTIQVDRVTLNERFKPDTGSQGKCDGRKLLALVSYNATMHVNKSTGQQTLFYKNTYEVWTHPYRDWEKVKVVDAGMAQIVDGANGPELRLIVDPKSKATFTMPVNLDGNGKIAAAGDPPVYRTFRVRRTGALNVPFLSP